MKNVGASLWISGVVVALAATFLYDPSIASEGSAYVPDQIINLQKLQFQLISVHIGLAMFIAGVFIHVAGELVERLAGNQASPAVEGTPVPSGPVSETGPASKIIRGADGRFHVGFAFFDALEEATAFVEAQMDA